MRLASFRITNFRSVEDSGVVSVGAQTCLVGKNEAGKTAILHALAGLNPHSSAPISFDRERDYPRRFLNEYRTRHPNEEANVVEAVWELDPADIAAVSNFAGPSALIPAQGDQSEKITLVTYRRYEDTSMKLDVRVNPREIFSHLMDRHSMSAEDRTAIPMNGNTADVIGALSRLTDLSDTQRAMLTQLQSLSTKTVTGEVIHILQSRIPKILYFSHYDRMAGELRLDDIQTRGQTLYRNVRGPNSHNQFGQYVAGQIVEKVITTGERVFVDFLAFAGTSIEEIRSSDTYESLNAKCEAASNAITDQLREYWTQNPFLEIEIRVTSAEAADPAPLNEGIIARARVRNTLHRVTVPFSERSAGFIWFFSFLVEFAQLQHSAGEVLLLLDEPGLTLHGKAQADLLRYFEGRILPRHQLIFSTHSPFMVPAEDLTQSRIVEDQIRMGSRPGIWITNGTKVRDDVLATDPDTLFPLQGALGYDVTQSLFVGKKTLLVEGPGDILFLKALSAQLKKRHREALDPHWTICPAGGIDKIQSFVSLFSGANLDIVVLSDFSFTDRTKLDKFKRAGLISADRILNYAELLELPEADVEDIFHVDLYLRVLNEAFSLKAGHRLTAQKLDKAASGVSRLVKRVEAAFRLLPPDVDEFDHFTPADWLIRNPAALDGKTPEIDQTLDNAEKIMKSINRLLTP